MFYFFASARFFFRHQVGEDITINLRTFRLPCAHFSDWLINRENVTKPAILMSFSSKQKPALSVYVLFTF
jgi:hypothetical protein